MGDLFPNGKQDLCRRSLAKIRITNPLDDAGWTQLIDELVRRHPQWPNQVVYMHITRGVAKRDHAFPENATPTVFAMTNPFTPPTLESIGEGLSVISVPDERWLHCDIKSISLLGNILARQTAVEAGAIEAVLATSPKGRLPTSGWSRTASCWPRRTTTSFWKASATS